MIGTVIETKTKLRVIDVVVCARATCVLSITKNDHKFFARMADIHIGGDWSFFCFALHLLLCLFFCLCCVWSRMRVILTILIRIAASNPIVADHNTIMAIIIIKEWRSYTYTCTITCAQAHPINTIKLSFNVRHKFNSHKHTEFKLKIKWIYGQNYFWDPCLTTLCVFVYECCVRARAHRTAPPIFSCHLVTSAIDQYKTVILMGDIAQSKRICAASPSMVSFTLTRSHRHHHSPPPSRLQSIMDDFSSFHVPPHRCMRWKKNQMECKRWPITTTFLLIKKTLCDVIRSKEAFG